MGNVRENPLVHRPRPSDRPKVAWDHRQADGDLRDAWLVQGVLNQFPDKSAFKQIQDRGERVLAAREGNEDVIVFSREATPWNPPCELGPAPLGQR